MFVNKKELVQGIFSNQVSTESQVVSQEGIGDLIKGVKRIFSKSAKEYAQKGNFWFDNDKDAEELKKAIASMYLNDSWLKLQKFSKTEVDAKGFSPKLSLNGSVKDPKANIAKAIADYEALAKKWYGMISPLHAKVEAVEKETKVASARIDEDDKDALIAVWEKGVSKLEALEKEAYKLQANFPGYGTKLLGNVELAKHKDGYIFLKENTPTQVDTLPALDKDGVKWAATLILEILHNNVFDFINESKGRKWLGWLDHSDGDKETSRIYEIGYSTYEDFFDFFYHQSVDQVLSDPVEFAPDKYGLIGALERWISLSIK